MVKDDLLNDEQIDSIPTIDDFVEEEGRNKRKRSNNIFLEDDFDDMLDYDDDDLGGTTRPLNRNWVDDGLSDVDDLFDDEDF